MDTEFILSSRLYFSFSQFMVYDKDIELPGCAWKDTHSAQGFARRDSVVNFGTLLEFGFADVICFGRPFPVDSNFERAIAVPFRVTSGIIVIEGPEEEESDRTISLEKGDYRLTAAQKVTGEDEETIHLYFEKVSCIIKRSSILIADQNLRPPETLCETAEVAGE